MKDISIVQKLITVFVLLVMLVIGLTVLLKPEPVKYGPFYPDPTPTPTPMSGPMPVYPNSGKE
jgi:hypothetical protein